MIRVRHIFALSVVFILVCDLGQHRGMLKHMKKWLLLSISSRFWVGPGVDHTVFCKKCDGMSYICVPNAFYCALKSRSAVSCAQKHGEYSNLGVFSR